MQQKNFDFFFKEYNIFFLLSYILKQYIRIYFYSFHIEKQSFPFFLL